MSHSTPGALCPQALISSPIPFKDWHVLTLERIASSALRFLAISCGGLILAASTNAVIEAGHLAGIITDGDLRRLMQSRKGETLDLTAAQAMTKNPATIGPRELASTALSHMEQRKITSVVVVDAGQKVCGVVHLHDLWTLELY